jgi:peptide deformylase
MALRDIRIWPDPILSTRTQRVTGVDDAIRTLVADLFETMYHAEGIGLAANQVGENKQVLVMDLDPHQDALEDEEIAQELTDWGYDGPICLINPVITHREGELIWDEGCLSVPGITEPVTRSELVTVSYIDTEGAKQTLQAAGLYAVCIQHEMDHLAGKTFVEYLSPMKQSAAKRKMMRLKKLANDGVSRRQAS